METGLQLSQNLSSLRWKVKEKKAKCFITERSRGIASWIRFGVEGMNKLLLGVEECCRVSVPARRPFEWRENERYFHIEVSLMLSILLVSSCKHLDIFTYPLSGTLLNIFLAHLVMAYSFLLVLHSNYKPIVMLIRLVAQTPENLFQDGVCFLVMLISLGNARSKIPSS